jgi:hypothetical protein
MKNKNIDETPKTSIIRPRGDKYAANTNNDS